MLEFEVSVESYPDLLIIDIKYVKEQTNNIYINKQTNIQYAYKSTNNRFSWIKFLINLIYIDFTIFCLQTSIQIDNVSKQGKNLTNKQTTIRVGFEIIFQ